MSQKSGEITSDLENSIRSAVFYEGTIPHPEILKGLKDVDNSFPERIMKMTEESISFEMNFRKQIISDDARFRFVGQLLTLLIVIIFVGAAVLLATMGLQAAAVTALVACFGTIAGAAIKGVTNKR
jgi:uncharacterized membrane protein